MALARESVIAGSGVEGEIKVQSSVTTFPFPIFAYVNEG
jgi:hypothetical protein